MIDKKSEYFFINIVKIGVITMFDNDSRFTIGTNTDFDKRNTNTTIVSVSDNIRTVIMYKPEISVNNDLHKEYTNEEFLENISRKFVRICMRDEKFILCHNIHIKFNVIVTDTENRCSGGGVIASTLRTVTIYGDKVSRIEEQGYD